MGCGCCTQTRLPPPHCTCWLVLATLLQFVVCFVISAHVANISQVNLGQVWAYGCLRHEHAQLLAAAEARALTIMPVWTQGVPRLVWYDSAIHQSEVMTPMSVSIHLRKVCSQREKLKGPLHFVCHGSYCVSKDVSVNVAPIFAFPRKK